MAVPTLTPEQQAALDLFEVDAAAAAAAHLAKVQADADLATAQLAVTVDTAADVTAHQAALASAQAFIDLMIPPQTPPGPLPTSSGKK
jgi:hypothetical protein